MKTPAFLTACALGATALFTLPACSPKATLPEAPDAAMRKIADELGAGKAGIIWTAMPASYQTDLTALVREAGTKVDPELYDRGFSLVGKVADVLGKQRAFILAGPLGANVKDKAALEANWDSVVSLLRSLATSKASTAAGLKNLDLKALLETTGSEILAHAEKLSAASEKGSFYNQLKAVKFELEKREGANASLRVTQPDGTVTTTNLIKVEDRWVPTDLAGEWATNIAKAKADLAAVKPEDLAKGKPKMLGAFAMAEGVIDQLAAAKTQEEFDQALQGAMMPIMGLMMMSQGGLNLGAPTP
jgi:hypothetical protein